MPVPLPANAKKVFATSLLTVYEWPQALFDGTIKTFECCVRPDSVAVIPFLDKDTILFGKQSQPNRGTFLDVPGGRVESGEKPEDAAKRELLEETGYAAKKIMVWSAHRHTGIIQFESFILLAKDLEKISEPVKEGGEAVEVVPTPLREAAETKIQEAKRQDIASVLLALTFDPASRERLQKFLLS